MHKTDNSSGYNPIDSSLPDMQLALQGLKNSQQAVQEEIARQASSLEKLQASRRQRLENQVNRLLPDFSGATLDALAQACPVFVDDMVRDTFRQNGKILGIFSRPGAATALTTLKIRLAFFLDTQQGADLRSLDAQIASVNEEKHRLEKLRYEVQAAIKMLEKYQASGEAVPAEVQAYVRQLAERARQIASRQVGGPADTSTTEYDNNNYGSQDNSAAYPWLYYSQGINHNVYDEPVTSTRIHEDPRQHTDTHAVSGVPVNCVTDASNASTSADQLACRTDDSLGAYS
jgi:prefoldin subunit 5